MVANMNMNLPGLMGNMPGGMPGGNLPHIGEDEPIM
jgi:hypothetical protein